jgi:DNA-binding protein YbaB
MARTADRNVNHALMARFAEVQGQYERMRDGLADLQRHLARMLITVKSTDELVTATVNARGQLSKLELDARAYHELTPEELAASITATCRQATEQATRDVGDALREYLPPSSGASRFAQSGDFGDLLARYDERAGYSPKEIDGD